MICPSCKAPNDDSAEACFTCGRALVRPDAGLDHRRPLRDPEPARQGRHGHGLQGPRPHARRDGGDQGAARRVREHARRWRSASATRSSSPARSRTATSAASTSTARTAACATSRWSSSRAPTSSSSRASAGGCLEPEEAFDVAIQIADGLQAIHDVGIIHRDLKTSNIMRDARGLVRLMDFGIAKIEGARPQHRRRRAHHDRPDHGHARVHEPRAVPGRQDRPPLRHLRARHRDLRDVHRRRPVPGRHAGGDALQAHPGPGAVRGRRGRRASRSPRCRCCARRSPRTGPTASPRPRQMAEALRQAHAADARRRRRRRDAHRRRARRASGATRLGRARRHAGPDRRRVTRLDIFVNFVLRRVGTLGHGAAGGAHDRRERRPRRRARDDDHGLARAGRHRPPRGGGRRRSRPAPRCAAATWARTASAGSTCASSTAPPPTTSSTWTTRPATPPRATKRRAHRSEPALAGTAGGCQGSTLSTRNPDPRLVRAFT